MYTIEDYEAACKASNKAFWAARAVGFEGDWLVTLAFAMRHEKEVRAWLETNECSKATLDAVLHKFNPPPPPKAIRRHIPQEGLTI